MMAVAQKHEGKWEPLASGTPVYYGEDVASFDTVMTWEPAEREAFGVYEVGEADPVPTGKVVTGTTIGDKAGRPVYVNTLGNPPPRAPATEADVDAERDRRLTDGITFQGVRFQTDEKAQKRIEKAKTSAMAAMMANAQPGDLQWHGQSTDFFWIALDNSRMPMDAQTMVAFGNAMAAMEGMLIVAASDLKNRITAGQKLFNVSDDALWPAV